MGQGHTECEFGTGNALLRYGIDTRCAKQPPVVREAFSEGLMGYRRHTKLIRCYDLDNYSEKNYTFVKILYSGVRSLYDFWKADNKF